MKNLGSSLILYVSGKRTGAQKRYRIHQERIHEFEVDHNWPHVIEFPAPVHVQNHINQVPKSSEQTMLLFL